MRKGLDNLLGNNSTNKMSKVNTADNSMKTSLSNNEWGKITKND
jgi:hypothetical protein